MLCSTGLFTEVTWSLVLYNYWQDMTVYGTCNMVFYFVFYIHSILSTFTHYINLSEVLQECWRAGVNPNDHDKQQKWSGKKLDAIQLGWPHLGRKKKSTASVEDGEQEVAAFWEKIWGWGSYSDTKTESEPIMLYCCKQATYWDVGGG